MEGQSTSESLNETCQPNTPVHAQQSEKPRWADRLTRLRRQAARLQEWLATHGPKMGKQGKEIKSNVTENDSAKMATSHGVIQGYNAQAFVDAQHQVIMAAEVFGDGTDSGHLSAVLAGAKRNMQVLGHEEGYCAGKKLLADPSYFSDGNLKSCEEEHLDAYIPDPQYRPRASRLANQERDTLTTKTRFRREDFQYDERTERYRCPNGKLLRLKARASKRKSGVYRLYVSNKEDCQSCELRAHCLSGRRKTRRNLSIPVEQPPTPVTRSQQMIAKMDTDEGRRQYRQRFEIVEPVFANIRTQKRLDHFTLRGKQKVDIQWMLYSLVHHIEKILHYGKVP